MPLQDESLLDFFEAGAAHILEHGPILAQAAVDRSDAVPDARPVRTRASLRVRALRAEATA